MKAAGEVLASVIVVNHNMAAYVPDCLVALLDQAMPPEQYEVIFADNASTDASADLAAEFSPAVQVLRYPQNYGFADGNNRAIAGARGRYLVFLNADTVVHRRWLPELVRAMQAHPSLGACQSNMVMPWSPEFAAMEREALPHHLHYYDFSRFGFTEYRIVPFHPSPVRTIFLTGASVLVDRRLLPRLGMPFDPRFRYVEDVDLSLRVNALGRDTAVVPTSVVYHRAPLSTKVGPDWASFRKIVRMFANRYLAYYKTLPAREVAMLWPRLLLGTPFKLAGVGWSRARQAAYFAPGVVAALTAGIVALAEMPRLAPARQAQRPFAWFYRHIVGGSRPPLVAGPC